jgi:hypothetical protein
VNFLFAIIQFSNQKIPWLKKIFGWQGGICPPKVKPMMKVMPKSSLPLHVTPVVAIC